jgi:hypothetical protein
MSTLRRLGHQLLKDWTRNDDIDNGIFADCYGRWGGRFSLIVPCLNGKIPPNYWAWLETFDPDIVYSYVPLSRVDVLEVHERLAVAEYSIDRSQ